MRKIIVALMILCSMLFIISCIEDNSHDESPTDPAVTPTMKKEVRSGIIEISQGATLGINDLQVVTFTESSDINQDGGFSVQANEANKYQLLFVNSKINQNPVYIGLYNPRENVVQANIESTIMALTLFNPYLIYTNQVQREEYINAVRQNSKYPQLVSLLTELYQMDANTALDYDTHPVVYQIAVQIMKEAMESLTVSEAENLAIGDPPYIKDAADENITFVNPRHVFYAAGIYPNNGNLNNTTHIGRKETILSYQWGWPPVVVTEPEETHYGLGDGYYKIHLTNGIDFSKLNQWNDPVGRATVLNSAQVILYTVELIIGKLPVPDFITLPRHLNISSDRLYALEKALVNKNVEGFLIEFFGVVSDNSEEIAYWIWQETQSNAAHHFLETATSIFKKVTLVFELLGYVNDQGPFIWDLVFAPRDISYYITQANGIITSNEKNDPPVADFSIAPPAGIIGTVFAFDASFTTDDKDTIENLQFRWDWESDGTWDTGWSGDVLATHAYTEKGAFSVLLEVKDSEDLIGSAIHSVNVGGGAGTAKHIKLFQDNLPWKSNAMVTMLENLGFTKGTGDNTYEIISSTQMAAVPLIPGEDLVIISNDQNQVFYNNYSNAQVRFTNFVYMGGSMFWEACDKGWANGSILDAGIVLPGNIATDFDFDGINTISDQNLPLVSELPNIMDHNYASHESFLNLPDGATIYCLNEESEPTLVEFNLGAGWIIVTGQPLEHQYDHIFGAPDMEKLLPGIVSYFTGKPFNALLPNRSYTGSNQPSYIIPN